MRDLRSGLGGDRVPRRTRDLRSDLGGVTDPRRAGRLSDYQCQIRARKVDILERERIRKLLEDALAHPEDVNTGTAALNAIASYFNIRLPDGVFWKFEKELYVIDEDGRVSPAYGWNPYSSEQHYLGFDATTGGLIDRQSDDSFVYISGKTFTDCNWSLECIAGILFHEAGYPWLEFKRADPDAKPSDEQNDNEELFLNDLAIKTFGSNPILDSYSFTINLLCEGASYSCKTPLESTAEFYGMNPAALIIYLTTNILQ